MCFPPSPLKQPSSEVPVAQQQNPRAQQSATLPKISEQPQRPVNVELDPMKQQVKHKTNQGPSSGQSDAANIQQQYQQHQQQVVQQQKQPTPGQAQNSIKGAVQPPAPPVVSSEPQNRPNAQSVLTTPTAQGGRPLNVSLHSSLGIQVNQPTQMVPMSPVGVAIPGGGGGLLTTATPTSALSNSLGNPVELAHAAGGGVGGGHMMSHDPADDSVFSPGIADDERMKLLERVSFL